MDVLYRGFPKLSSTTKIVRNGDLHSELELGDHRKLEIASISRHSQTPSVTEIRGWATSRICTNTLRLELSPREDRSKLGLTLCADEQLKLNVKHKFARIIR